MCFDNNYQIFENYVNLAMKYRVFIPFRFLGKRTIGSNSNFTKNNIVVYTEHYNGISRKLFIHNHKKYTGRKDSYVYLLDYDTPEKRNNFIEFIKNKNLQ